MFYQTYKRLVDEGEIGEIADVDESAEDEDSFFKIADDEDDGDIQASSALAD